jgi:hypothetical protein
MPNITPQPHNARPPHGPGASEFPSSCTEPALLPPVAAGASASSLDASSAQPTAADLCVTCQIRVGRPRATVLHAVVCGPCWAAHGGFPDAGEIGPAPTLTVPSADPRNQQHWLSALQRQDWVRDIRADGQANLLAVAELLAWSADWETLESRPTWARLVARSGLSERTVARWLQELRVRGWLMLLEHGSTPAHRPTVLAHLSGNRAAVYGLRIPLSPEEALHCALDQLAAMARLAAELTDQATPHPFPTPTPTNPDTHDPAELTSATTQPSTTAPDSTPSRSSDQRQPTPGDTNGSPSWSLSPHKKTWVGGFSRASKTVDNLRTNQANTWGENKKRTALRAGSDKKTGPDWAVTVPTSRFAMLIAADWLRHELPVFASCSRKLIRHLCKPYWRTGWCNRDIVHATDHRPGVFHQTTGVLISPERIAAPKAFITSRLAAWRTPAGAILPGHWTSRRTATTQAARRLVAARHGRAGAALLRPGEHTLTATRITEHGRTARPPANPTTRATAKATLAATLTAHARRHAAAHRPDAHATSLQCNIATKFHRDAVAKFHSCGVPGV